MPELTDELREHIEQELVILNHTKEYADELRAKCSQIEDGASVADRFNDIYYTKGSYDAALLNVYAVTMATKLILEGQQQRGYCITRPPGHHSKCSDSAGFCIFNNVAIAARLAANAGKRVCIFDWDIHHGDGTQRSFYEDENVLFISLHRCDNFDFYPRNKDMAAEYVGKGKGKYRTVNVAWHTGTVVDESNREANELSDLGNNEYQRACQSLLLPMVNEFQPDIIFISCGFDGGIHDFLGWSQLSPLLYFWMTRELLRICPNVLAVQEGGYNVEYLGQHASGVVQALEHFGEEAYSPPATPADKDVGISSVDEIDASQCK